MTKTVKKYTRNAWSAMEIDLHAIKSVVYIAILCLSARMTIFVWVPYVIASDDSKVKDQKFDLMLTRRAKAYSEQELGKA